MDNLTPEYMKGNWHFVTAVWPPSVLQPKKEQNIQITKAILFPIDFFRTSTSITSHNIDQPRNQLACPEQKIPRSLRCTPIDRTHDGGGEDGPPFPSNVLELPGWAALVAKAHTLEYIEVYNQSYGKHDSLGLLKK